jgi:hypothetical protein
VFPAKRKTICVLRSRKHPCKNLIQTSLASKLSQNVPDVLVFLQSGLNQRLRRVSGKTQNYLRFEIPKTPCKNLIQTSLASKLSQNFPDVRPYLLKSLSLLQFIAAFGLPRRLALCRVHSIELPLIAGCYRIWLSGTFIPRYVHIIRFCTWVTRLVRHNLLHCIIKIKGLGLWH